MPSSKEFIDFVVAQSDLSARKMMGEFQLYYSGSLIGGVYDNRLLLKTNSANASLWPPAPPLSKAMPLLFVGVDGRGEVRKAILATAGGGMKG